MDSNKRLFIAFSITMILIVAIVTSFGGNLFSSSTPSVSLPPLYTSTDEVNQPLAEAPLQRVEISTETVQGVIASLQTQESYYRTLTTQLYWDEENSAQTTVEVWTENQVTQVKKTLASGAVRYDVIYEDWVYYWYDSQKSYLTIPVQEYSLDIAQSIPSYQSVLSLDPTWIEEADYRLYHDVACIFVQAQVPPLDFTQRFWLDAQSGLLLSAETLQEGQLLYRMEGFSPISLNSTSSFTLPDGAVISTDS